MARATLTIVPIYGNDFYRPDEIWCDTGKQNVSNTKLYRPLSIIK
jgi:hypothetical protein